MPVSPVAVGLSLETAKDRLQALVADCPTVDLVVNGGARGEIRDHPGIVWLTGTTNVTEQTGRGGLGTESFDLQFLIEAATKFELVPAGPNRDERQSAADRSAEADTRSRRWQIAQEIGRALQESPGALDTSSAKLAISSEHAGFAEGYWIARVYGYVSCSKFRTSG